MTGTVTDRLRLLPNKRMVTAVGHSFSHPAPCLPATPAGRAAGGGWGRPGGCLAFGKAAPAALSVRLSGLRDEGGHVQQQHHQHLAGPQGRGAAQDGSLHGQGEGRHPAPPAAAPHAHRPGGWHRTQQGSQPGSAAGTRTTACCVAFRACPRRGCPVCGSSVTSARGLGGESGGRPSPPSPGQRGRHASERPALRVRLR